MSEQLWSMVEVSLEAGHHPVNISSAGEKIEFSIDISMGFQFFVLQPPLRQIMLLIPTLKTYNSAHTKL